VRAEDARTFAEDWAAAWNELAVDRVLTYFHVATVPGKHALRDYWNRAVVRVESLRFVIERVLWGASTRELAIIYDAEIAGRKRRVSENVIFGTDGLVIRAEVFHGVETERSRGQRTQQGSNAAPSERRLTTYRRSGGISRIRAEKHA
jgi:hypothetical protein